MRTGVWFTILGIIYMCGGNYEWEWMVENSVFTFKDVVCLGYVTMLFGVLMTTVSTVGDNIVEALKKED